MTPLESASFIIMLVLIPSLVSLGVTGRPIIRALSNAFQQTLVESGKIFLLLIGATLFARMLNSTQITASLMDLVISAQLSPLLFIIILGLAFLLLGSIFESISLIAVSLPVIYPLSIQLGFDPVWFAVFITTTLGISYLIPPAGKHVDTLRTLYPTLNSKSFLISTAPFLILSLLLLMLIVLFPQVIITLPNSFFS